MELRTLLESVGVILLARTCLGLLLVASGLVKLFELELFARVVRAFALLPRRVVRPIARTIPVSECLIGCVLLGAVASPESSARWGAIAAIVVFAVFGAAVAINLMRGRRNISCGCFGAKEGDQISWFLVARNVALLGIGYLAFQRCSSYLGGQAVNSGERLGALLMGLSVLLGWQLTTAIMQLAAYQAAYKAAYKAAYHTEE